MDPPILPAYSLRVQLFLSTAHSLGDKPVRNFRVVTSPKITVRKFCVEASRIHEINYGEPLSIKKVQDDQGFDITQSEILGNLFSASSIVRIVQAQKYLHMRDSIPPTSGLRFNPSLIRRREKREETGANGSTVFWGANKRRKISYHDPDNPLPSREVSLPISHDNAASEDLGMIDSHKVCQASIQISETPEPAHASQEIDLKYLHGHTLYESATTSPYDNEMLERQSSLPTIVPGKNFTSLYGKTNCQKDQATLGCLTSNAAASLPGLEEQLSQNRHVLDTSNNHIKNSQQCIIKELEGVNSYDEISAYNKPRELDTVQEAIPLMVSRNELSITKHGNRCPEDRAQILSSDNHLLSDERMSTPNDQISERSSKIKSAHNTKNRRSINCDFQTQQSYENFTKQAPQQWRALEIGRSNENNNPEIIERDISLKNPIQQESPNLGTEFGKVEEPNSLSQTIDNNLHAVDIGRRQRKKSITKQEYEKRVSQKNTSPTYAEKLTNHEMNKKNLRSATSSGRKLEKESRQSPPSTPNVSQVKNYSPNLSRSKYEPICSDNQPVNPALQNSPKKSSFPTVMSPSKSVPQNEVFSASAPSSKGGRISFQRVENDKSIKPPHRISPDTSAPVQTRVVLNRYEAPPASKASLITKKTSVTPILPPKKKTSTAIQVSKKILGNTAAPNSSSKATSSSKPCPSSKVTPIIPPKSRHSMINSLKKEKNSTNSQIKKNDNDRSENSLAETSAKRTKESFSAKSKNDELKPFTTPSKIITDQKNLRHPRKHSQISQPDGSKDHTDGFENEEDQSQDSDERDSRSPVAFHYTSQLPKTQQSPSLSSESQLEIEDDEDTEFKNVSVTPKKGELRQHSTCLESRGSRDPGEKELHVKLNAQTVKSTNDGTPIISSKIDIPNSSLPLNQNLLPKESDRKAIKSSQYPNRKRPQFGFGASLNAMHRNGGIMGKLQSVSTTEKKGSAVIQNDAESFSESEASNSELDSTISSEPGYQTQSKLPDNSAAVLQGSESDSDDSNAEEERAKAKAKAELLAKVRSLNSSQKSESVQNIRRSGRVNVGVTNYQSNQRKK
ncbi:putative Bgh-specific protein [Blumeria hordei DH14]|uniref:Putative Bgh-specific protein n=1 Tax=Blumeria graminis f. sp. hordei (strain DH14) TaxID=546991 RepID=N1JA88_BLUG1|nr:putative Bgh-specific protein [Blumeria hordei DH14]